MSGAADFHPIRLPGGRTVPEAALTERAVPAGGPGGQHANRTASKVELRIDIAQLPLREAERERLQRSLESRLTSDGDLVLTCAHERSQWANRRIVRQRAERLLAEALRRRRPRIPTRKSRAAKQRAREAREQHSAKKASRRWRPNDD